MHYTLLVCTQQTTLNSAAFLFTIAAPASPDYLYGAVITYRLPAYPCTQLKHNKSHLRQPQQFEVRVAYAGSTYYKHLDFKQEGVKPTLRTNYAGQPGSHLVPEINGAEP